MALSILRAFAAFVLTSLLVVYLVDLALSRGGLGAQTLGLLLRGTDPFRGSTVAEAVAAAAGRSAALLVAAFAAAAAIGFVSGLAYAFSSSRTLRAVVWGLGTVGASLPSFFWTMLLVLTVVLVHGRTGTRILPISGFGLDEHLVLPALALAARPAAYVFRTTATALDMVRHADYVRTAHAKGLLGSAVAQRHILPNAAPAILTGLGLAAHTTLSSLAIVEYVFSWHGAGYAFIHSLAQGRVALATAIGILVALCFMAVGAGIELLARRASPRDQG